MSDKLPRLILRTSFPYVEFGISLCPLLQHGFFSFRSSSSAAPRLGGFARCLCCRLGDLSRHPICRCRHYVDCFLLLLVDGCNFN